MLSRRCPICRKVPKRGEKKCVPAHLPPALPQAARTEPKREKEKEKHTQKAKRRESGVDDNPLRRANRSVKVRILLEARVEEYEICYRRVKSVNELVINGVVYDEKKGVIEFAHNLSAVIDGHTIEAGLSDDSYSYIMFDGECLANKQRLI